MARVELGISIIDWLHVLAYGRKDEPVICRPKSNGGLPTAGEVVGSSLRKGTIDVKISDGMAVELTPEIIEKLGPEIIGRLGLNNSHIGCRLLIPRSPGESLGGVILRLPGSEVM